MDAVVAQGSNEALLKAKTGASTCAPSIPEPERPEPWDKALFLSICPPDMATTVQELSAGGRVVQSEARRRCKAVGSRKKSSFGAAAARARAAGENGDGGTYVYQENRLGAALVCTGSGLPSRLEARRRLRAMPGLVQCARSRWWTRAHPARLGCDIAAPACCGVDMKGQGGGKRKGNEDGKQRLASGEEMRATRRDSTGLDRTGRGKQHRARRWRTTATLQESRR